MNFYVGTSGYSYPAWKGSFYPEKTPARQFLNFYATRFRSVEVNATFSRMPATSVLEGWAAQVPDDFRFVLKAPRGITHIRRLKEVAEPVATFLTAAGTLKQRLGPLLLQFPPNFKKACAARRSGSRPEPRQVFDHLRYAGAADASRAPAGKTVMNG